MKFTKKSGRLFGHFYKGSTLAYTAKILADSLSPLGDRLTTFEITFPRIVLAEFNTHRMFSRNSASSRAIPVRKIMSRVLEDPFIPVYWGKNQPGMSAVKQLDDEEQAQAEQIWLCQRDMAVDTVMKLQLGERRSDALFSKTLEVQRDNPKINVSLYDRMIELYEQPDPEDKSALNVHKQIANRLLEPWMWHTVIVTATEWSNFFALRTEASAQPEIRHIAQMMHLLYHEHVPDQLDFTHWHLPLVDKDEFPNKSSMYQASICTGRCCRVSYLTHDGKRDPAKDIEMHDSLLKNGHMSPFEHPARPMTKAEKESSAWAGNFYGWVQYRKTLENEADFSQVRQDLEGSTWCEDCLNVHSHR